MTNPLGPAKHLSGRWVVLGLFGFVLLVIYWLDLGRWLNLSAVQANRDALLAWTHTNYFTAVILFILIYTLQTVLVLPGAALLSLLGGFLFNPVLGALYVNIGATGGATGAFLASRYLFRDVVERKFGDRLAPLQAGIARDAFHYLLTLRLIPLFPFFLVNLLAGLTRIRTGPYVLATSLGILPASFVFCNAGRQLGTLNSLDDVASPRVLGALALLGVLALAPMIYRKWNKRAKATSAAKQG